MDSKQLELIKKIGDIHHRDMQKMGWSNPDKSNDHYLMLTIGEICEAIQAHRKGHVFYSSAVPDDFVAEYVDDPHTPKALFMHTFEYYCKDTTMDEFADVMLRLLSLLWLRGWELDIPAAYIEEDVPFTSQAIRLVDILRGDDTQAAVNSGIAYIMLWADCIGIDIVKACGRKMRYNRMRTDWKNKEKQY